MYKQNPIFRLLIALCLVTGSINISAAQTTAALKKGFLNPPDSAKPGVYWYFMDGNMTAASMTKDLEAMKKAGIGNVIFLEVNVGIPRGKVDFLSEDWQNLFKHAVKEAERLGITITLGIGPGWTGSGGPWVPGKQSMQHLVSSTINVSGGNKQPIKLPVPPPMKPYFGEGAFTPELKKRWNDFYEDVAVLAYPTPTVSKKVEDIDEKALYYRAPYSSVKGVKQYLPSHAVYEQLPADAVVPKNKIINLTGKLKADGTLNWIPPAGNWTVMRFGVRNNGAVTRPAPIPGVGFESDKFDTVALYAHLDNYVGKLIRKTGIPRLKNTGGLKRLHMDSWEMGSQNWTAHFRQEFIKRRGYDPLPFYPVYAGAVVQSLEISERFLWDLRQTSQELVLEYHAAAVKKYAHKYNLKLSIEPYDMNPTADLELGNIADVPMAEFWSKGFGFNSSFSCFEATSIGHVNGKSLIPAESFTAQDNEGWKQFPGSMKNQGDWAFANGINQFVFHTFQNQVLPDSLRPGMTMGPYGVHWDRNQTWWPMAGAYHQYITRSSYLLQQGNTVADVLYLTPEGSPHVFRPPFSAIGDDAVLPDRKGYNFDGCAPGQLYKASVKDGKVVFPGGANYRLLVLPGVKTMTPALLNKIAQLVRDGATVVGPPPVKSPGLSGYPACDNKVSALAKQVWGDIHQPGKQTVHAYGKGRVIWGGDISTKIDNLYPEYSLTAGILKAMDVKPDFEADGQIRYTHRTAQGWDMYFVSNISDEKITANLKFRTAKATPQLWDPVTGETKFLPDFKVDGSQTTVPLQFDKYQSYFVIFDPQIKVKLVPGKNFAETKTAGTLDGQWQVSFDPKWGGPADVTFDKLQDWTTRPEEGIKFYSGTAVYHKEFELPANIDLDKNEKIYLNLGEVHDMARVKLNGKDLGVIWTAPWQVDISKAAVKGQNKLEIEIVNRWPNRLIGDSKYPDDGVVDEKWPDWLLNGGHRNSKRLTFASYNFYDEKSPLLKSGLVGPVTIEYSGK